MLTTEQNIIARMFDQSDECYLIYDISQSQFIYANKAFESITGRTRAELLTSPGSLISTIHADDQEMAVKIFRQLLRKRSSTFLDFRIVLDDERERWVRLKVYPIAEKKGIQYLAAMLEDDTARKAGILNMHQITAWKDSLLEILAHDLRGPISIVKTLTSAIDRQLTKENQENILKWTKLIRDICEKNIELIHGLIQKESLLAPDIQLNKERVDLTWEVNEVIKVYQDTLAGDKLIKITSSHENICAQVDSMKFLQIINNLISNAIKFTGHGALVAIHLEKLETSVLITVADNGIGIPRHLQPILFNKYTRAAREGVDGQESIGLGMWIVKTLTVAHGGRVWFETKENMGSKFYVELPLGEMEEEPEEHLMDNNPTEA